MRYLFFFLLLLVGFSLQGSTQQTASPVTSITLSTELQRLMDINDEKKLQLEVILNEYNGKARTVIANKGLQHMQRKRLLDELKAARDQKMHTILTESQVKIFVDQAKLVLEQMRIKRNAQKNN